MAYRAVTKLDFFIKEHAKKVSIEREKPITIREVMDELGEFADISWQTVKQIKNKDMQPSIAVALLIAQFFNVKVEDIWTVEEYENVEVEKVKNIQKPKKEKSKCNQPNCEDEAFARGMCNKHYQSFRNHNPHLFNKEKTDTCSEPNCNNPYHAKGLCSIHYNKHYRESRMGND